MVDSIIRLIIFGMLPVLLSVAFYLAEKRTGFSKLTWRTRQVIIGVCFGALAVLSTECGIEIPGAIINVRDAAPLTAGLIFGGPAGIIAAVIGGVERWLAPLWGGGEFTRLACTIATVMAGVFAAAVRKFLLDDKRATWAYALAVGIATEVLHMIMIFLTNANDIRQAFEAVQACAMPMILANGLSVMLSALVVTMLGRSRGKNRGPAAPNISQTFQTWLLVCVLLAFVATGVFVFSLESRVGMANVDELLLTHLQDVQEDISDASDANLLSLARRIDGELARGGERTSARLKELMEVHDVGEINLVGPDGIIYASTNDDFVNYNMATGEQSAAFLVLLRSEFEFVQEYQPTSFDPDLWRKYAGIRLVGGGFLQVGYDASRFQKDVNEEAVKSARNRHIGQSGCIIVCNEDWEVVSDREGYSGKDAAVLGVDSWENIPEKTRFTAEIYGEKSYCAYVESEGYHIIAVEPVSEALYSRNVAVYVLLFMEILVFALLFATIVYLVKKVVVDNIRKVNGTLAQITGGNLDVTVNVRTNQEFASLSDDINSTVMTLKHYIAEAAARIDKELEFAKQIQHSALPSVFPPYPNREDFSIFASMDTAKEVGGDFYDFYLLGEDKLVFLVADVSGKGIPAAMFMMTSKTLLKDFAEGGMEVNEVFTRANAKLCEGNEAGMFVTAWMGVLDLQTGLLSYANAGHNPPLIRHKNGEFEYLHTRPNFILAGMDGVRYKKHELQLRPGDEIYLYTDGVTEAQNLSNELYGEDRLLVCLNEGRGLSMEELCRKVKGDVDAFAGEADQFDDITMVAVCFSDRPEPVVMTVEPTPDSVASVAEFLEEQLDRLEVPMKKAVKLKIALDEIYSNIVRYSGATNARVECLAANGELSLVFRDNGKPYNPLEAEEPDITASAEERSIGGLGILMVRKMMDKLDYMYKDGQNILTLQLNIES